MNVDRLAGWRKDEGTEFIVLISSSEGAAGTGVWGSDGSGVWEEWEAGEVCGSGVDFRRGCRG